MKFKNLYFEGVLLNKEELYKHLEKIASNHNIISTSLKNTYPIPRLLENYYFIKKVYNILNENIKIKIPIHPAGEWILDNFYAIEETIKSIRNDMTLKKYIDLPGISSEKNKGFARIYILASEIVNYTDSKISKELLEECLKAYQTKKSLSMDEIWNIGIFMQISIIENIRTVCEKILMSQIEKIKAESIIERLVEGKSKKEQKYISIKNTNSLKLNDTKYSFIEYMSYRLKKYGKKTEVFLNILEEEVEKNGISVSEVIKREHFNIAVNKLSVGNSITSIKKIQRINFLEIFEKINGVEEILKKDPSEIYEKMDFKTKDNYRNKIKTIAKKAKVSEVYVAKKILDIAKENNKEEKKGHIGYYLQDKNINIIYNKLQIKNKKVLKNNLKTEIYISLTTLFTTFLCGIITYFYAKKINNIFIFLFIFLSLLIPISEGVIKIIQFFLSKYVKPNLIPKLDFYNGVPEKYATFVIIPTILATKEKTIEMLRNLEVDYLANKSENIYFCLLGDCKESSKEYEEYDNEIMRTGIEETKRLNIKYESKQKFPIFHFIYRRRKWNESEKSYLGWERKRGAISEFIEFILGNYNSEDILEKFNINTITDYMNVLPKIKYLITLDSDTELSLNSGLELIGSMAHILNYPEIEEGKVTDGYGIIQPRVGINLDISYKTQFTKIFAGNGGIDSYSNVISDFYQDNFGEGIFTGKGIFDIEVYSKILKNEIPENIVLSHDLLEGNYLRCGFASDILIMDGYPSKYTSFILRLSRWIRGDWQIVKWLNNYKLNILSKFKIFDNLRRSLVEFSEIVLFIFLIFIGKKYNFLDSIPILFIFILASIPSFLDIINNIIIRQDREQKQKTFTPKINGYAGILFRAFLKIGCLPYKAYISIKAICKTLYRLIISKRHLLEWLTSEEAEKSCKNDIISYFKNMGFNLLVGLFSIICIKSFLGIIFGIIWITTPAIMYLISKDIKENIPEENLNLKDIEFVKDVGKRTWKYFYDNLNEKNNYLIPDNMQEDRKNLYVDRTSATNIGLSLLSVISAIDLKYIEKKEGYKILEKIIQKIVKLEKWNGHLYNWYNIFTLEPLIPKYVSTVDSGNFVRIFICYKSFFRRGRNRK